MDKKFISSKKISDYEILTDEGFKDVIALHKTIPYDVYNLVLENKELKCADFHIVFSETGENIFVKDLNIGDKINTVDGIQEVLRIENLGYQEEMWDFELGQNNCKYYTNGILSHNTSYLRKLIAEMSDDKIIIYVPPFMMQNIVDPEFIEFITRFRNSIIILDDSEVILTDSDFSKQAINNILNLTDGLLNDAINVQIIATYNSKYKKALDPGLKRYGRLVIDYEFKKLTVEEANKLSEHIKLNKKFDKPVALAEIYKGYDQIIEKDDIDEATIGFKIGGKKKD